MNYFLSFVMFLCFSVLTGCLKIAPGSKATDKEVIDKVNLSETLTLNWNPIFQLEDGSDLQPSEIDSYTIHWGRSSSSQTEEILVSDPEAVSHVFTATESGDYYFSVSVETIYGSKSSPSNVVHKEVN